MYKQECIYISVCAVFIIPLMLYHLLRGLRNSFLLMVFDETIRGYEMFLFQVIENRGVFAFGNWIRNINRNLLGKNDKCVSSRDIWPRSTFWNMYVDHLKVETLGLRCWYPLYRYKYTSNIGKHLHKNCLLI